MTLQAMTDNFTFALQKLVGLELHQFSNWLGTGMDRPLDLEMGDEGAANDYMKQSERIANRIG